MDLDEVAHYEPPHQDLRCLQSQLFSSPVVKELNNILFTNLRIHYRIKWIRIGFDRKPKTSENHLLMDSHVRPRCLIISCNLA